MGRWSRDGFRLTPLRLDLTDETDLKEALANHPLNEETALAVSPARSSPEAAASVREDEAVPSPEVLSVATEPEVR